MEPIAEYQFDFRSLDNWFKGKLSELIISYIQQNKKLVNNVDVFLNIYASESIFEFAQECARDHWSEPEMLVSQVPRYHFKKLLDILGERKCENIYEEMRDKGIIDYYITDYIDKGVDVVHKIRRFIDLNRDRTEAKSIIARYLREINEDEIKEWRKEIYGLEFIEKLSDEQKKFFAKYLIFDYVAIMKDEEICTIKVKLPTMEQQTPHFSDEEKEAIKEAKNAGINIILATVNFGPSWNFTVKLTKLEDTEIIAEYQIDFRKLGNWLKGKLSEFIVCELIQRKYTHDMDIIKYIRSSQSIRVPHTTFYRVQDAINKGEIERPPFLQNLPMSEKFCEELLYAFGERDLASIKSYREVLIGRYSIREINIDELKEAFSLYERKISDGLYDQLKSHEFFEKTGIEQMRFFDSYFRSKDAINKGELKRLQRYLKKLPELEEFCEKLLDMRDLALIEGYSGEINIDEIKEAFSLFERRLISEDLYDQLKSHEFFEKMSIEQMKFFAKYVSIHLPFDYVAIMKDEEICIIEVKSTTMGRQSPNFSDKEKEAIHEAKNVGISVIVATVNYEPSWNLRVKLIKL